MLKELKIEDDQDVLFITARQNSSLATAMVGALTAGAFVVIVFHAAFGIAILGLFAAVAGGLTFLVGIRRKVNELRVTKLGFNARGTFGDSFRTVRTVSSADVRWLEYQEDTTGPETSHHPGGLYAVLRFHSVCILPDIDRGQTNEVIGRITDKFPTFKEQWNGQSAFGRNFTSLELNDD